MKRALIFAGGGSRGAFQIGVWKYLKERNWMPDIICGTSVGAINAVGIASGLDTQTLIRLWTTHNRRKMYQLNLVPFLSCFLSGRALKPLLDTRMLQQVVSDHLDFNRLKNSRTKVVISAVNVHTARSCFFDNSQIGLAHVLASSALPILFPWHNIDGVPHWDGGVMTNIPLQPALDFGADEIIIAMLSPIGHTPQPFPRTVRGALEHVFEQFLASAYQSALLTRGYQDSPLPSPQLKYETRYHRNNCGEYQPNIITLAPSKMLGFRSLLNFSPIQAKALIQEGYTTAYRQLKPFI
ncbi:MAG: patatin-like phospholipase family protein [Proteobacteria bacterium]|nr:patatin-like phospholipase family protein [Pseudomonadota bacterium]MBU4131183.1 patatin-like phospholipase family protein [Pseudomonadota bacterium]